MLRLLIDYSLPLTIDRGQAGSNNIRSVSEDIALEEKQFAEGTRYTDIYGRLSS